MLMLSRPSNKLTRIREFHIDYLDYAHRREVHVLR
jgi:hypothetical protein